jgi:hypothetical protein
MLGAETASIQAFLRSKRQFRLFKSVHRQELMPSTRAFNAGKSEIESSLVHTDYVDFAKAVFAGTKMLLPRRNLNDIDVPNYPEVGLTFLTHLMISSVSKHFTPR